MASFFGEVLPPRSRILDDEDLDAMEEGFCEEFKVTSPPELEKNLLIVCEGSLPGVYTQLCFNNIQACGEILGKSSDKEVSFGKIFRGSNWTVVTCEHDLKQQEFLNLGNTILGLMDKGCQIICLTARHISEFRVEEMIEDESVVRCLSSKSFPATDAVKRLEIPNLLTGLSAAILSIAIVKGLPCFLLVNYVDLFTPDSMTLQGYQSIFKLKCLQESSLEKPNVSEALKSRQLFRPSNNLYI
eukprot:TRINITY_DN6965_c0_g1_i11.p1 TRINITY_DN6965_c0_g1~~TRINITY_DN6965_c0_g1_i11.p1  ORF type:complete len:243 (-),score=39.15 TRINITY_DN6965_c0_g1_i11:191-919(-)